MIIYNNNLQKDLGWCGLVSLSSKKNWLTKKNRVGGGVQFLVEHSTVNSGCSGGYSFQNKVYRLSLILLCIES